MADSPAFVLDACALLRVAQAEQGMDAVVERLRAAQRGECRLLLHQINLGEVVYRIGKVRGWALAASCSRVSSIPAWISPSVTAERWRSASGTDCNQARTAPWGRSRRSSGTTLVPSRNTVSRRP